MLEAIPCELQQRRVSERGLHCLVRSSVQTRTPQPSFDGRGFILHLILCSFVVVGIFVGLLWLLFILSFGRVTDDLRSSAAAYLEGYLSSQVVEFPWDNLFVPAYGDELRVIKVELEPDYLATLSTLGPCDRIRCEVDKVYRVSAEYEVNGEVFQERFTVVETPYWSVAKFGE